MLSHFLLTIQSFSGQVDSAKAYVIAQDVLSGYMAYSKALDIQRAEKNKKISLAEEQRFSELYGIYLLEDGQGDVFEEQVSSSLIEHPEWMSLLFFKAALLANRGDICAFFDTFELAFTEFPDHFLAHKIRGAIAHRIYQLTPELDLRDQFRKTCIDFFLKSFALNPNDVSLISRIVLLSRVSEQKMLFSNLLPALSKVEKPPARKQCWLLLEIASKSASKEDCESLYSLMRKWFPQSRFLDEWERRMVNVPNS